MTDRPIILWFRRDLRLGDHPMLSAAVASGRPLIPIFIHDEVIETLGAAPRWRFSLGIDHFASQLARLGSRLILRRGAALPVLRAVLAETGATDVWWTRTYDPDGLARDMPLKAALKADGVGAHSFPGGLLFEPMGVATADGGPYRVYTPFWRAVKDRPVERPLPPPAGLRPPATWPASDAIADWGMGRAMHRGAKVVAARVHVGEAAALKRLDRFLSHATDLYGDLRDFPGHSVTSGLSENLTYGEIGPRTVWFAAQAAMAAGARGAERFLMELVWREFAWHLLYHTPHLADRNWRTEWDSFPWRPDNADAERWRRGIIGVPIVDAGLREMFVTGTMHNRVRMVAASYLTKHLLTNWRVGQMWFADCLIDWDPASNAMGWQWVAGSGPDAAPYFRVFNPDTQAQKFDAEATYQLRWIAEGRDRPAGTALSYFDAIPKSWNMAASDPYPSPILSHAEGRARALAAYQQRAG